MSGKADRSQSLDQHRLEVHTRTSHAELAVVVVAPARDIAVGQEALGIFQRHRNEVRLILTDLMMPVMDGLDLVRAVKGLDPGIRVIAASGLDAEVSRAQLAAIGVSEILMKPIQLKVLLKAIREQLE